MDFYLKHQYELTLRLIEFDILILTHRVIAYFLRWIFHFFHAVFVSLYATRMFRLCFNRKHPLIFGHNFLNVDRFPSLFAEVMMTKHQRGVFIETRCSFYQLISLFDGRLLAIEPRDNT